MTTVTRATTSACLGKGTLLRRHAVHTESMRDFIPSTADADNTKRNEFTRHLSAGILGNPQAVEDTCPSARKSIFNAPVKRGPSLD